MSIYPRTEYEMSEKDLQHILDACKPVPYIIVGGVPPSSPQENANRAWRALGTKMGFDHMTVRPIEGKDNRHFTAIPNETVSSRAKREAKEKEEIRQQRISVIKAEQAKLAEELEQLTL